MNEVVKFPEDKIIRFIPPEQHEKTKEDSILYYAVQSVDELKSSLEFNHDIDRNVEDFDLEFDRILEAVKRLMRKKYNLV